MNPILILKNEKTGKIQEEEWDKLKRRISKEDRERLEKMLKEGEIVLSFYLDEWEEVKYLLDKKSRKYIEKKIFPIIH